MIIIFKEPSSRSPLAEAKHLLTESKTLKISRGFSSLSGSSTSPQIKPLGSTSEDIPKRSSKFYLFLLQLTLNKPPKINFREREILFFSGEKCVFSNVGFFGKGRWRQKMVSPL
ncbi:hypothetical protein AMTRI_Chr06g198630 [Amborella trichopoda]